MSAFEEHADEIAADLRSLFGEMSELRHAYAEHGDVKKRRFICACLSEASASLQQALVLMSEVREDLRR